MQRTHDNRFSFNRKAGQLGDHAIGGKRIQTRRRLVAHDQLMMMMMLFLLTICYKTTKIERRFARYAQPSLLASRYPSHFLPACIPADERIRATRQSVPVQHVLDHRLALSFRQSRVP